MGIGLLWEIGKVGAEAGEEGGLRSIWEYYVECCTALLMVLVMTNDEDDERGAFQFLLVRYTTVINTQ